MDNHKSTSSGSPIPHFGVPPKGTISHQPEQQSDCYVTIDETGTDSPHCSTPKAWPESKHVLMSQEQLFAIINAVHAKKPESEAETRIVAEKLINIAPRFDLRQVDQSLKELEIFFSINNITSDSLRFMILQGRLPWATMVQFGEEYPSGGGNFGLLVYFLRAYTPVVSPARKFSSQIGAFGEGSLFKDMYHSALMASKLDHQELVKLFCFIFSSGQKRELVGQHMDLPCDSLLEKLSRKWDTTEVQKDIPRQGYQCPNHQRFGANARGCTGFPCQFSRVQPKRLENNENQNQMFSKNDVPQVRPPQ